MGPVPEQLTSCRPESSLALQFSFSFFECFPPVPPVDGNAMWSFLQQSTITRNMHLQVKSMFQVSRSTTVVRESAGNRELLTRNILFQLAFESRFPRGISQAVVLGGQQ